MLETKIRTVIDRLKKEFLADTRPWVVTFSGGKDSTTVLQLVTEMLLELRAEKKQAKKVYIVSSDTGVEMPVIEDYTGNKLTQIDKYIKKEKLNMEVNLLKPKVTDSFWTLLLGKGYPSPNQNFRWCTDRLKIKPATNFLKSLTIKNESILMLLGVRSDESQARAQSIEKRDENHRGFSKHSEIPNAFVYSPVKDWTNADVWTYLSKYPAPWGKHNDMMVLYDKGSGEADCNIALNPEAASCGKTRFGCWVCTVVSKDKSMENMMRNKGDEWMEPLHHFRNKLEEYRYDHDKRQPRRRNGQKSVGPFLLSVRKEFLEELLEIEQTLINAGKMGSKKLISDEEIVQIQKEWLNDGDFFETAITMSNQAGRLVDYESVKSFNGQEKKFIESICEKNNIPVKLIEDLMQKEHSYRHQILKVA
ncbi:DNA phosphorothioation system sulfurtransferase DndC [Sulfurimonas autotrophica]|uniref:Phosphoadenosine phosphosulfate reductase n=1 Tax=Sulfurimonas autotrophica (strain ATCC BAA-671 / DSM 16294 / JCM 11897 / OK10) TaxID=563040 RepID=E0URG2_SULAO|nr:DNA phosphorothioation system sulfurtransferase DndC [Sulfurimonas autotrophica]ADN10048.1 phosphoadenosine phosphosulfate reductase [Sulfurimonas autotrophica DSM 16294]